MAGVARISMAATEASPMLLSTRQHASETLRIAIYDGRLLPGQRLTERQICAMAGVSRTIAREAVRELEAERLIVGNGRHGFIVARLSPKDIADLYDMRILLEAEACRLCAATLTAGQADELDRCMKAIEAAALSGDRQAQRISNARFYEVIFDAADNDVLAQMLRALHGRVSYLRSRSMSRPGRPAESRHELAALLEALKSRDGDEAARLSTVHITAARRAALDVLGSVGTGAAAAHSGCRSPS